jgi:low temperature requirement protein LtrA
MVIGIVITAFAMRAAITHVNRELDGVAAFALCGGSALYLLSYVAIRWRVTRALGRGRLVAAVAFVALFPVALVVPAIAALAVVTTTWIALHAYEIIWWREDRARSRALRSPSASPNDPLQEP